MNMHERFVALEERTLMATAPGPTAWLRLAGAKLYLWAKNWADDRQQRLLT